MPESVEEVQAVVKIADRRQIPLWTHSTGRNNGYGGPAPRVRGSLVVSLRNMNRVLEINEELGYAVVEPGVRWFDLYEAIAKRNLAGAQIAMRYEAIRKRLRSSKEWKSVEKTVRFVLVPYLKRATVAEKAACTELLELLEKLANETDDAGA